MTTERPYKVSHGSDSGDRRAKALLGEPVRSTRGRSLRIPDGRRVHRGASTTSPLVPSPERRLALTVPQPRSAPVPTGRASATSLASTPRVLCSRTLSSPANPVHESRNRALPPDQEPPEPAPMAGNPVSTSPVPAVRELRPPRWDDQDRGPSSVETTVRTLEDDGADSGNVLLASATAPIRIGNDIFGLTPKRGAQFRRMRRDHRGPSRSRAAVHPASAFSASASRTSGRSTSETTLSTNARLLVTFADPRSDRERVGFLEYVVEPIQ